MHGPCIQCQGLLASDPLHQGHFPGKVKLITNSGLFADKIGKLCGLNLVTIINKLMSLN